MCTQKKQTLKKFTYGCLCFSALFSIINCRAQLIEDGERNTFSAAKPSIHDPNAPNVSKLILIGPVRHKQPIRGDDPQGDWAAPPQEKEAQGIVPLMRTNDEALDVAVQAPVPPLSVLPNTIVLSDKEDLTTFRSQIKKDAKRRLGAIIFHGVQETGEGLKKLTPVLASIATGVILIPEPTGITKLIGVGFGLAAGVTGAVGYPLEYAGKKGKVHFCEKIHLTPSELKFAEEVRLLTKEAKYILDTNKSNKLQNKIDKKKGYGEDVFEIREKKERLDAQIADRWESLKKKTKL